MNDESEMTQPEVSEDEEQKKPSVKNKLDNAKFNKVVDAAEFISVSLKELRFHFDEVFFATKKRAEIHYSINRKTQEIVVDAEHGSARGDFVWSVEIKYSRKRVFFAEAMYSALYHGFKDHDEYPVRIFMLRTGRTATYPYFRALVAHLASDAGADIPPLPIFSLKAVSPPK